MGKYIRFGKYNTNYKFIILTLVFMTLSRFIPSFLTETFQYYKLIHQKAIDIDNHPYCRNMFVFLGMFIISFILYKYEEKLTKNKSIISKPSDSNSKKGCFKSIKIN